MKNTQKEVGNKAKRHVAIDKLIADVVAVDADESLTPGKRNVKHKNAAARYLTAIRDKRKKIEKQVKPNTLKRYITDVRKAVTERQWFHYTFQDKNSWLLQHYPIMEQEITAIRDAGINQERPLDAVRMKWKEINTKLEDAKALYSELCKIDVVATGWKKCVKDLVQEDIDRPKKHSEAHGFWADELAAVIKAADPKKAIDALREKLKMATDNDLYERIKHLKIDHEVMRHLVLPAYDKSVINNTDKAAVVTKHSNMKTVDYIAYMATVHALLNAKEWMPEYYQALTIGLIMVTGRRPIEIMHQGRFEKTGSHALEFSGQAKRRGGVNYDDKHFIYSLVPADLVLETLDKLRATPKIRAFASLKPTSNMSINQQIANRTGQQLNIFMDNLVERNNWPSMDAKHGRALYAKICVILFHRTDPRWKDYSEEKMVSILLCHEDDEAQKYYRNWHVDNAGCDYPVIEYEGKGSLIDELSKLDDLMFEADGAKLNSNKTRNVGARESLHNEVKALLKNDPDAEITNRFLRKHTNRSAYTIKEYLELAEPALQSGFDLTQLIGKQVSALKKPGPLEKKTEPKKMVPAQAKVEKQPGVEKETVPEKTAPKKELPAAKKDLPKVKLKDQGDGSWLVTVTDNKIPFKYTVQAESLREAGEKAWAEHTQPKTMKKFAVEIHFNKGAFVPVLEIDIDAVCEVSAEQEAVKQIRAGGIQSPIKKISVKAK